MGLDMYFYARKESYRSCFRDAEIDTTSYPTDLERMGEYIKQHHFKSATLTEDYQIGYFRKFNALHGYIVDNFADGKDDCQVIYLSKENIEQILEVCKRVKENHDLAESELPTQSGFFFGGTEYDDWYFDDVDDAIELFELILKEVDLKEYEIIYRASW